MNWRSKWKDVSLNGAMMWNRLKKKKKILLLFLFCCCCCCCCFLFVLCYIFLGGKLAYLGCTAVRIKAWIGMVLFS